MIRDQPIRRLTQLLAGLLLYGLSIVMMVKASLGLMPWDVLHQGLSIISGFKLGQVTVAASIVVLLLWIPLRQRPGIGTLANALLIGLSVDILMPYIGEPTELWGRVLLAAAAIGLNGVATAAYIGAELGPGPRDGLMTGLVRKTGLSVRLVRTALEVSVVLTGWLLGGTLGVATAAYALLIGPIVHPLLPLLSIQDRRPPPRLATDDGGVVG